MSANYCLAPEYRLPVPRGRLPVLGFRHVFITGDYAGDTIVHQLTVRTTLWAMVIWTTSTTLWVVSQSAEATSS
jgi:hypothetical protein